MKHEKMFDDVTINHWTNEAMKSPVFTGLNEAQVGIFVEKFADVIESFFTDALSEFKNEPNYDVFYFTFKTLVEHHMSNTKQYLDYIELFYKDTMETDDLDDYVIMEYCRIVLSLVPTVVYDSVIKEYGGEVLPPVEISEEIVARIISGGKLSIPINFEESKCKYELSKINTHGQNMLFALNNVHDLRIIPAMTNYQDKLDNIVASISLMSHVGYVDVCSASDVNSDTTAITAMIRTTCVKSPEER